MFLGAIALAVVSFSVQKMSLDTRSDASLVGNQYPVQTKVQTVDSTSCSLTGWAVDKDDASLSTFVVAYLDRDLTSGAPIDQVQEGHLLGSFSADHQNLEVAQVLQVGGNHGFVINLSNLEKLKSGSHQIYLYAAELGNNGMTAVTGSPVTLRCDR